jgi:hypothetical protein
LVDAVTLAVSRYTLTPFRSISETVRDDYGPVGERRLYRIIKRLLAQGVIEQKKPGTDPMTWGYIRRKLWTPPAEVEA